MSSQITSGECQQLLGKKTSSSPPVLQRSGSLQQLRKFNTYICAQNFYMLPALLAWLRAPHSKLHDGVERCIAIVQCVVYATFVPRAALRVCRARLQRAAWLHAAVYGAVAAVFVQLTACVYIVCTASGALPAGFVFLCTCLYVIAQMNFACLRFYLTRRPPRGHIFPPPPPTQRLSRRATLGRRTISNMSLI